MCLIASGAFQPCEFSAGGLAALYLVNKSDIDQVAGWTQTTPGVFDTVPLKTGAKVYGFDFAPDTASAGWESAPSNGQTQVKQTVKFSLQGAAKATVGGVDFTDADQAAMNALYKGLALGKFVAIAQDSNGIYSIYGRLLGLQPQVSKNSGAAGTDFAGGVITLERSETEIPQVLKQSAGDALSV